MLLDTSALIEVIKNSDKGKKIADAMLNESAIISLITLAELVGWCKRENKNILTTVKTVKDAISIVGLDETICLVAGSILRTQKKAQRKFGMIDALIYCTAQIIGEELWTTDVDFKGLSGIRIL